MKRNLFFILLSSVFIQVFGQYQYLENPNLFEENKLEAMSFFIFDTQEELREITENPNYLLLNGIWKFHHSNTPEERPIDFYQSTYNVAYWEDLPVPSDWQMYGYDYPIYTNWKYPFKADKPNVPRDFNPVGSYKRNFILPSTWDATQNEIILHLAGVNSCFFVWINGQYLGYSEDSKLPSEFLISDKLQKGENQIAIEVYKYCDGTYLEDQDMWRLSGIERDVFLYQKPKVNLEDVNIEASLDESYTKGLFNLKLTVESNETAYQVELTLLDNKGNALVQRYAQLNLGVELQHTSLFKAEIPDVQTWSAEHPNLYTLEVRIKDLTNNLLQKIEQKVGFKKLEIKDGIFYINGDTALIKGVNRHEHDPNWGHAIGYSGNVFSLDDMRKDLELIKSLNFNAIRTAHYPNHPAFYDLCDELGIYVCDEANIEAHWYMMFKPFNNITRDEDYQSAILSRIYNMYQRDKNHPSIIMWSVGNENGTGPTMVEAYKMLKKLDSERPVFNERHFFLNAIAEKHSDFNGNMYAPIEKVQSIIDKDHDKPFIWIEYAHAMGNSSGNFKDLWDFVRSEPQVQGGFIWDWRDQGIWKTNDKGEKFLAFGGHFEPQGEGNIGGLQGDGNFCANGVLSADGKLHPAWQEISYVQQPVQFTMLEEFNLLVKKDDGALSNRNLGLIVIEKRLNQADRAYLFKNEWFSKQDTIIPLKDYFDLDAATLHLNLFMSEKGSQDVFIDDQILVNEVLPKQEDSQLESHPLKILQEASSLTINCDKLSISFNENGKLINYSIAGHQLIQDFGLNFWRAPTDNDFGNGMPKRCEAWREVSLNQNFSGMEVLLNRPDSVLIQCNFALPKKESAKILYAINQKGELKIQIDGKLKGKAEIPRIGSYIILNPEATSFQYYGRGPEENYQDRNHASFIQNHLLNLNQQSFPYIRPQEYGNRTDCLSLKFGDLQIESDEYISFSAWNHSLWDLEEFPEKQGKTSLDIPKRDFVWLNIDHAQMGVGGDNSWGRKPYDQYLLKKGEFSYSYTISLR